MPKTVVRNGPKLNPLRKRQPAIDGYDTLVEVEALSDALRHMADLLKGPSQ